MRAKKLTPGVNNHAVENPLAFNANSKTELHNIATGSIAAEEMKEDTSNVQYVERSERFILRHLTQATTEDIFYSRKFLESNPKCKTLTSFRAQHNFFEASYRKQDKNRRFKRCTFLETFWSTSLNFLFSWSAKKINKEQAAT